MPEQAEQKVEPKLYTHCPEIYYLPIWGHKIERGSAWRRSSSNLGINILRKDPPPTAKLKFIAIHGREVS
jgi:hypothetical protein